MFITKTQHVFVAFKGNKLKHNYTMQIIIDRKYKKAHYTIGNLYINGIWQCNTLEDPDRGLTKSMTLQQIKQIKVYGNTAIPTGTYLVTYTYSNKFKALMPLVVDVPGWSGVLLHVGNTPEDTLGCILVGMNKVKGKVIESKVTFKKVNDKIRAAYKSGEKIYLTIK